MMSSLIVLRVDNLDTRFCNFVWHLNKDQPNWIAPLVSSRKALLDEESNPGWEYLEGQAYIAVESDRVVGTIMAVINHRHNQYWNTNVGWFGFFDCINSVEVASMLLSEAENWLTEKGVDSVMGPQSLTTHDETGLLIDNFDQPVLLMPWNQPYYQELLEKCGYKVHTELFSFLGTRTGVVNNGMESRLSKITDRLLSQNNITIRPFDLKNKNSEFTLLREVYAKAWDKNFGFVPLTDRELDHLVDELGMLVDSRFAYFAFSGEQVVGMAVAVPDLNQAFARARPHPNTPKWLTLLRTAYHWKLGGAVSKLRYALLGVHPDFRHMGIDLALTYKIAAASLSAKEYESIDCGWVLATNPLVNITEKLGLVKYKTHAWFSKDL